MNQKGQQIVVQVDPELEDLIPGYLENRHTDVQSIFEALERGDCETIRVLAHSMKGSGGGYGFDAITEINQSMEQAAKSRNKDEIRKLVHQLLSYLNRVEVVYE